MPIDPPAHDEYVRDGDSHGDQDDRSDSGPTSDADLTVDQPPRSTRGSKSKKTPPRKRISPKALSGDDLRRMGYDDEQLDEIETHLRGTPEDKRRLKQKFHQRHSTIETARRADRDKLRARKAAEKEEALVRARHDIELDQHRARNRLERRMLRYRDRLAAWYHDFHQLYQKILENESSQRMSILSSFLHKAEEKTRLLLKSEERESWKKIGTSENSERGVIQERESNLDRLLLRIQHEESQGRKRTKTEEDCEFDRQAVLPVLRTRIRAERCELLAEQRQPTRASHVPAPTRAGASDAPLSWSDERFQRCVLCFWGSSSPASSEASRSQAEISATYMRPADLVLWVEMLLAEALRGFLDCTSMDCRLLLDKMLEEFPGKSPKDSPLAQLVVEFELKRIIESIKLCLNSYWHTSDAIIARTCHRLLRGRTSDGDVVVGVANEIFEPFLTDVILLTGFMVCVPESATDDSAAAPLVRNLYKQLRHLRDHQDRFAQTKKTIWGCICQTNPRLPVRAFDELQQCPAAVAVALSHVSQVPEADRVALRGSLRLAMAADTELRDDRIDLRFGLDVVHELQRRDDDAKEAGLDAGIIRFMMHDLCATRLKRIEAAFLLGLMDVLHKFKEHLKPCTRFCRIRIQPKAQHLRPFFLKDAIQNVNTSTFSLDPDAILDSMQEYLGERIPYLHSAAHYVSFAHGGYALRLDMTEGVRLAARKRLEQLNEMLALLKRKFFGEGVEKFAVSTPVLDALTCFGSKGQMEKEMKGLRYVSRSSPLYLATRQMAYTTLKSVFSDEGASAPDSSIWMRDIIVNAHRAKLYSGDFHQK